MAGLFHAQQDGLAADFVEVVPLVDAQIQICRVCRQRLNLLFQRRELFVLARELRAQGDLAKQAAEEHQRRRDQQNLCEPALPANARLPLPCSSHTLFPRLSR